MRSGACVIGSMWPAPATVTVDARGAARASPSATNSAAAGLVVPVTTSVGTVSFRKCERFPARVPIKQARWAVLFCLTQASRLGPRPVGPRKLVVAWVDAAPVAASIILSLSIL